QRVFTNVASFSIGRDSTCTIPLKSKLISRTHVMLAIEGSTMRVCDQSRNGTLVGQQYLQGSELSVPLGTPIKLGEFTLWFRVPGAVVPPVAAPKAPLPEATRGPDSSGAQSRDREIQQSAERAEGVELRRQIHGMLLEHLDMGSVSSSALDDPSLRPKILTALRRIVRLLDERIPPEVDRDALIG